MVIFFLFLNLIAQERREGGKERREEGRREGRKEEGRREGRKKEGRREGRREGGHYSQSYSREISYINHLEFFCLGVLFSTFFIQSFFHNRADSWMFDLHFVL